MIAIYIATNGQYYYVVKAHNNRVLVTSETMKQKGSIINSIDALLQVTESRLGKGLIVRDGTGGHFPQYKPLRIR